MRFILIPLAAIVLSQCGAPQPPSCQRVPFASRGNAGELMESARRNWDILANPRKRTEWPDARDRYNKAVAILFDQLRCGGEDWTARAAAMGTIISANDSHYEDIAKHDAIFPASEVDVEKENRHRYTQGLGIPTVAWRATTPVGIPREKFYPPNGQARNLTAVLNFDTKVPQWHFPKRWVQDDYRVGFNTHSLAADWTAPIDFFWQMCDLDNLRIQNVILPERFTEETGLYFLQGYDPKKIPVVMVHGLVSSPDAYRHILNELSPEPWFREHYQVWLYNYPTGTPWLYNAMRFRQIMGEAGNYARSRGDDVNLKKMVILSHSMGGLLSRAAVTDPGTKLYDAHFKTSFAQLESTLKPESRKLIREGLLYKPLTDPKRVVFMAVPLRGSPMANFRGTAFLSNLIRLPKTLTIGLLDATAKSISDTLGGNVVEEKIRPPTAISSLSPSSKGFIGLNQLPLPKGITFHSIMGDKGHGDTPNSSDGVVPYWSSHIEPVESEIVIDSNHSVPNHPAAAAEIKRILLLHLKEEGKLRPARNGSENSTN
jgi:pimeloyl-ACP methyl ester carboxylesterase